jgi:phenylalanyl-tRNA synthetase beta chain
VSRPIAVENPMREEQAVMRSSLLANLLAMVAHNLAFGIDDVRLFEIGSVFLRPPLRGNGGAAKGQLPDEPRFAAAVITGSRAGWLKSGGAVDFYDLKGIAERVFAELRLAVDFVPARREDGFLHPGVAAAMLVNGVHVGVLGEVHPETRERFGIGKLCFVLELNLEALPAPAAAQFTPLMRFPAIARDVSFFVDESVPAAQVRKVVDAARPALLEELRVVEDYREAGKVPAGKKGMLWSMTYRDAARTLTDAEVDAAHEVLVARMLNELSAQRR